MEQVAGDSVLFAIDGEVPVTLSPTLLLGDEDTHGLFDGPVNADSHVPQFGAPVPRLQQADLQQQHQPGEASFANLQACLLLFPECACAHTSSF